MKHYKNELRLYYFFVFFFFLNISVCQELIRQPFPKYLHELNSDEWQLLDDGFSYLRSIGFLREYANMHASHFGRAHDNPFEFFPFHGRMIRDLEEKLKEYDERLALPIWDLRVQTVYPSEFSIMTANWPEIRRIRPPDYPISRNLVAMVRNINYNMNYLGFISYCSFIHNDIHNNYGGTFGSPFSPLDPMFWSFHAFWEEQYTIWSEVNNIPKQQSSILR